MNLPSFAAEAKEEEAVVLNCVQSEVGDNGYLQSYLRKKEVQVLHTGSDVQATELCHDKVSINRSTSAALLSYCMLVLCTVYHCML